MAYNFVYDPKKSGFDTTNTWKQLAGTTSYSAPYLVSNADEAIQLRDVCKGDFIFNVNVPAAPAKAILTGGTGATAVPATWAAVANGEFAITIDGVARNITGIDFTGLTTMADIAAKIQLSIRAVTLGSETVTWSTDHFIITAFDAITVTSAVAGGTGTDISGAGATDFLDADTGAGNGVVTLGGNSQFGLLQLNQNIGAYFKLDGNEFTCNSHDKDGVVESTLVAWNGSWTTTDTKFIINWSGAAVEFFVGGVSVARHNIGVPSSSLSIYFRNTNANDLKILYIDCKNVSSIS